MKQTGKRIVSEIIWNVYWGAKDNLFTNQCYVTLTINGVNKGYLFIIIMRSSKEGKFNLELLLFTFYGFLLPISILV